MPTNLNPGFITLHGNQLEQLRSAVFSWMRDHPLDSLEEEVFLVQSNGVAEWLKISIAEEMGVCAATQVTLPARFLWRAYRTMLGSDTVPKRSALDEALGLSSGTQFHSMAMPLRALEAALFMWGYDLGPNPMLRVCCHGRTSQPV